MGERFRGIEEGEVTVGNQPTDQETDSDGTKKLTGRAMWLDRSKQFWRQRLNDESAANVFASQLASQLRADFSGEEAKAFEDPELKGLFDTYYAQAAQAVDQPDPNNVRGDAFKIKAIVRLQQIAEQAGIAPLNLDQTKLKDAARRACDYFEKEGVSDTITLIKGKFFE